MFLNKLIFTLFMGGGIYNGSSYIPGKNSAIDSWISEWGAHFYPVGLKNELKKYDRKNKLGDVVLDLGSGPYPLSFDLENIQKIILVDVVPMVCSFRRYRENVIPIWGDIDKMLNKGSYYNLKKHGSIDTVIASSIF